MGEMSVDCRHNVFSFVVVLPICFTAKHLGVKIALSSWIRLRDPPSEQRSKVRKHVFSSTLSISKKNPRKKPKTLRRAKGHNGLSLALAYIESLVTAFPDHCGANS
jgi:hypothetical protein